ncbi:MAG TPA: hypothetical protein VKA60_10110 [Blastocatellia bacterium]|nr:hypothetical protein [Blastocatellia bacterium]
MNTRVAPAGDQPGRADLSFIHALDEWIEWRAAKLQDVRRGIVAKTRPVYNPSRAQRARAATRG